MYCGDTTDGWGLRGMLWEVVANAIDEHLAGRCSTITIGLSPGARFSVEDDGGGIPLTPTPQGISFAELALTTCHDTATLDGHAPHVHTSSGVGLCPVNALCSRFVVDVWRDGAHHTMEFARGRATENLRVLGPTSRTGTRIEALPDPEIFRRNRSLALDLIDERLLELSAFYPGLRIERIDQRGTARSFQSPRGLVDLLVASRNGRALGGGPCTRKEERYGVVVDLAIEWTRSSKRQLRGFANAEPCGGAHVVGMELGILHAFYSFGSGTHAVRIPVFSAHKRLLRGLNAVVHVTLANPLYGAPTKDVLRSVEARKAVLEIVEERIEAYLFQEPELLKHLLAGMKELAPSRPAAPKRHAKPASARRRRPRTRR